MHEGVSRGPPALLVAVGGVVVIGFVAVPRAVPGDPRGGRMEVATPAQLCCHGASSVRVFGVVSCVCVCVCVVRPRPVPRPVVLLPLERKEPLPEGKRLLDDGAWARAPYVVEVTSGLLAFPPSIMARAEMAHGGGSAQSR